MIEFTLEGGTWTAHDPDVPGAYGLGPTREAALADLREATDLLEELEDARAADEACDAIAAGEPTYTHEEVRGMLGMDEDLDAATVARLRARLADIESGKAVFVPLEEAWRRRKR